MVKPLDQRVREAIGGQAWVILTLQQTCDEQAEQIAALKAEIERLTYPPPPA